MPKILGSRKQEFEVVQNRPDVDSVEVDGREHRFGRSGMFKVDDPGVARDIKQSVGQDGRDDVIVVPTEDQPAEPGHTYMFRHNGVPWAEYDELGRRIYPEDEE